jgi:2-methylcitrate dehydratase PrpD
VYQALSIKPFCSAKQAIAAVEAFRTVVHEENVHRAEIAKIRVGVPSAYAGMIATRAEPGARQSSLVSVAHQIALAALAPERLYDVDRSTPAADTDVMQFAAKVEVVADAALQSFYPQHWPAEVDVEAGGKTFQRRVVAATGDPEHALSRSDIDEKAHRVLDGLIGAARVDQWLAMCHGALHSRAGCQKLVAAFASFDGEGTPGAKV